MITDWRFPFGEPVRKVAQAPEDRGPKKVFVLGVYASAVHAWWVGPEGKRKISALAIASEPCIFWTGEGAEEIIQKIQVPPEAGGLEVPSVEGLNGPSGRALDELFLTPLGFERKDAWLCDLLPESRMNPSQKMAIERHYLPICEKYGLPVPTVPEFDRAELDSEKRRGAILDEIWESKAETLVLLGDLPIHWFLEFHGEPRFSRLSQFGNTADSYGRAHKMKVDGVPMEVIPLCHPRQAGRFGSSSAKWGRLHKEWIEKRAGKVLYE